MHRESCFGILGFLPSQIGLISCIIVVIDSLLQEKSHEIAAFKLLLIERSLLRDFAARRGRECWKLQAMSELRQGLPALSSSGVGTT
jgi:hypothetical protein